MARAAGLQAAPRAAAPLTVGTAQHRAAGPLWALARTAVRHGKRQPLRPGAWPPYTSAAPAQQGHGFDSPKQRRNSRAGYPIAAFCCAVRFAFNGRACGEGRKSLPVPLPGLSTPHVLSPSFDSEGGRFQTCRKGAIHG